MRRAESAAPAPLAPRAAGSRRRLLSAAGLPTTRDENWRYANLRALERLDFVPAAPAASAPPTSPCPQPCPASRASCSWMGASRPRSRPPRWGLSPPLATATGAGAARPHGTDGRFALLNEAFATDGAVIRVPGGAPPARLELMFLASAAADSGGSYPRIELELPPARSWS